MIATSLRYLKDFVHAQFCYQLFITPTYAPIPKEYRAFARQACEFLQKQRSELLQFTEPRHHVIHRFSQKDNPHAKKILITHGWMSRAAYMARFIHSLRQQGYDIYALDFPAHGEAKGFQLTWIEAVSILQKTMNQLGPFYGVIGHSFGGSMLLNALILGSQYPEWKIEKEPDRVILLASPTRMRTPVRRFAQQLKLTSKGYSMLQQVFRDETLIDLRRLDYRHYIAEAQTPFLCIHGTNDTAITPKESIIFCKHYSRATLSLLQGVDHMTILVDKRVENAVDKFLAS